MSDPTINPNRRLIGDLFQNATSLFSLEIDLARAELDQNLRRAAAALGMLVAAVVMLITALNVLAAALVAALNAAGIDPAWSAVIVGVVFAVVAWILMQKGMNDLKLVNLAPTRSVKNVKRDAEAIKGAASYGE